MIHDDEPTSAKAPLATVIGSAADGPTSPQKLDELVRTRLEKRGKQVDLAGLNRWDPNTEEDEAASR